ncbi:unnamed protein product [Menidia menidia]|uniref:(Atlantic silverside) hypothetical protein n=1 Tax=Menidia menidia TaxID=238744 RepID=A0A8S4BG45_9TELE|nr:unnamed protein product [Menidia menidia]
MYCPFCGTATINSADICCQCGRNIKFVQDHANKAQDERNTTTATPDVQPSTSTGVECFMNFRAIKERERNTFFTKKHQNKTQKGNKLKINVGLMRMQGDSLKTVRGKLLPVEIHPEWASEQVLAAAVKKQKDFNIDLRDCAPVLLYPDAREVKNIPGTDIPFTVQKPSGHTEHGSDQDGGNTNVQEHPMSSEGQNPFYRNYTNVYAPIIVDSDSEPDEYVMQFPEQSAGTLTELHQSVERHASILQTAGCLQFPVTVDDKLKLVKEFVDWYIIYRNHFSIQRYKDGLSTLNFLNALEQHASVFRPFMCARVEQLTSKILEEIFEVQLSEKGSSRRHEETRVLGFWRFFILDTEEQKTGLSLQDILMFATGLNTLPPSSILPPPKLIFQATSRFPVSSICSNTIKIPMSKTYQFKEDMDFGIQNSPGFGLY